MASNQEVCSLLEILGRGGACRQRQAQVLRRLVIRAFIRQRILSVAPDRTRALAQMRSSLPLCAERVMASKVRTLATISAMLTG